MQKLKLSCLGIFLLLVVSMNAHSTVKGCVNVFSDGTDQCSPVLLGTLCEIPKGSKITINGKKIVKKYQVNRCPDLDGLGRVTNGRATFRESIRKCKSDYDTCYDRCYRQCDFNHDGKVKSDYVKGILPRNSEMCCYKKCMPE